MSNKRGIYGPTYSTAASLVVTQTGPLLVKNSSIEKDMHLSVAKQVLYLQIPSLYSLANAHASRTLRKAKACSGQSRLTCMFCPHYSSACNSSRAKERPQEEHRMTDMAGGTEGGRATQTKATREGTRRKHKTKTQTQTTIRRQITDTT